MDPELQHVTVAVTCGAGLWLAIYLTTAELVKLSSEAVVLVTETENFHLVMAVICDPSDVRPEAFIKQIRNM